MINFEFKQECLDLCMELSSNPKVRYTGRKPSRYIRNDKIKPTHFWIIDNIQDNELRVFITYIPHNNSMFIEIDSTYSAMLAKEDNGQRTFNTVKEGHTVKGTIKSKLLSLADKSHHPERYLNMIYDMLG